jgi:hypothetical protein
VSWSFRTRFPARGSIDQPPDLYRSRGTDFQAVNFRTFSLATGFLKQIQPPSDDADNAALSIAIESCRSPGSDGYWHPESNLVGSASSVTICSQLIGCGGGRPYGTRTTIIAAGSAPGRSQLRDGLEWSAYFVQTDKAPSQSIPRFQSPVLGATSVYWPGSAAWTGPGGQEKGSAPRLGIFGGAPISALVKRWPFASRCVLRCLTWRGGTTLTFRFICLSLRQGSLGSILC